MMFSRFDLPNIPNPFDPDSGGTKPYQPIFRFTKELQFYLVYSFVFLLLLYCARAFFNTKGLMILGNVIITIDDLFMIFIFSLSSLYLVSFIFKYIIVKWNLNPDIQYGHLLSKQPIELFDMSLVYVEYTLSYKDNSFFAGSDTYIDIKEEELYSDKIYFTVNNQGIDYTAKFKEIENYKCQTKEINLTYQELMKQYKKYNLEKIISKNELDKITNSFTQEFCIELHYIENKEDKKKDIIVSDTSFFDNFKFDFKTLGSILVGIIFISFNLYDEIFIDTEQTYLTLLLKSIQYNIFFYTILFLIQRKYLYK